MKSRSSQILIYALLLSGMVACVHLTRVALINIQNDTNFAVQVNSRFAEQNAFSKVFTLSPNTSDVFMKYEETPGREEEIFDSFGELQLVDESGCKVQLSKNQIRQLAKRDIERAHWIIHIEPDLFKQAGCQ
jgi:hypothetical protein